MRTSGDRREQDDSRAGRSTRPSILEPPRIGGGNQDGGSATGVSPRAARQLRSRHDLIRAGIACGRDGGRVDVRNEPKVLMEAGRVALERLIVRIGSVLPLFKSKITSGGVIGPGRGSPEAIARSELDAGLLRSRANRS